MQKLSENVQNEKNPSFKTKASLRSNKILNVLIVFLLLFALAIATGGFGVSYLFITAEDNAAGRLATYLSPILITLLLVNRFYSSPSVQSKLHTFSIWRKVVLLGCTPILLIISLIFNGLMLGNYQEGLELAQVQKEYETKLDQKDFAWLYSHPLPSKLTEQKGIKQVEISNLSKRITTFFELPEIKLKLIAIKEQEANQNYQKAIEAQKNQKLEDAAKYIAKIPSDSKYYQDAQKIHAIIKPQLDRMRLEKQQTNLFDDGMNLFKSNDFESALQKLEQIPSTYSQYKEVKNTISDIKEKMNKQNYELATKQASQGQWHEAIKIMSKIRRDKDDVWYKLAQSHISDYQRQIAIEAIPMPSESEVQRICRKAVTKEARFPKKVTFDALSEGYRQNPPTTVMTGSAELMNGLGLMVPHNYVCTLEYDQVKKIRIVD